MSQVHADCDWGNWLVRDHRVTALLELERARLGDPADDWVLRLPPADRISTPF